jgi:hypothetical protein
LPDIAAAAFETSGRKFPVSRIPDCSHGRILFIRIRHGANHTHRNRAQSMTASAASLPDAEPAGSHAVRQLHIGLEHRAAGRIEQEIAA